MMNSDDANLRLYIHLFCVSETRGPEGPEALT